MTQPERPVDPPIKNETTVDQLVLAQAMLRDAEFAIRKSDIGKKERAMLELSIGNIHDQIEVLR